MWLSSSPLCIHFKRTGWCACNQFGQPLVAVTASSMFIAICTLPSTDPREYGASQGKVRRARRPKRLLQLGLGLCGRQRAQGTSDYLHYFTLVYRLTCSWKWPFPVYHCLCFEYLRMTFILTMPWRGMLPFLVHSWGTNQFLFDGKTADARLWPFQTQSILCPYVPICETNSTFDNVVVQNEGIKQLALVSVFKLLSLPGQRMLKHPRLREKHEYDVSECICMNYSVYYNVLYSKHWNVRINSTIVYQWQIRGQSEIWWWYSCRLESQLEPWAGLPTIITHCLTIINPYCRHQALWFHNQPPINHHKSS